MPRLPGLVPCVVSCECLALAAGPDRATRKHPSYVQDGVIIQSLSFGVAWSLVSESVKWD